jgi:hypothetical protein
MLILLAIIKKTVKENQMLVGIFIIIQQKIEVEKIRIYIGIMPFMKGINLIIN